MLRAATSGKMELSKEDLEDMVESMEQAEAHMNATDQEYFEKQLQEQKEQDQAKDAEK